MGIGYGLGSPRVSGHSPVDDWATVTDISGNLIVMARKWGNEGVGGPGPEAPSECERAKKPMRGKEDAWD